jgi:hypothetical protein
VIIEEKPKVVRSSIEEFDLKNVQDDYQDQSGAIPRGKATIISEKNNSMKDDSMKDELDSSITKEKFITSPKPGGTRSNKLTSKFEMNKVVKSPKGQVRALESDNNCLSTVSVKDESISRNVQRKVNASRISHASTLKMSGGDEQLSSQQKAAQG